MLPIPNPRSVAAVALVAALLASGSALAQDKLRIGKSVPNSWAFAATDVGVQTGIFKQEGIELAISSFKGDAQMQAGLTAGAVDVSLGSGPGLGFRAKGVPAIGVAAMYGAPREPRVGGARQVADQDHRRSQGQAHRRHHRRLADRLAEPASWRASRAGAATACRSMPLGSVQARLAAMERNDLDALVIESATGFELEELKRGRIILHFGDIEKNFYTHVIFATDNMVEKRPDALRRFLRGWFKTIAFIRANKAETVKITVQGDRGARKHREPDLRRAGRTASRATAPGIRLASTSSASRSSISASWNCCRTRSTIYNDQFVPVKF